MELSQKRTGSVPPGNERPKTKTSTHSQVKVQKKTNYDKRAKNKAESNRKYHYLPCTAQAPNRISIDSAQPDYAVKRGLPEIPDRQILGDPLESGDDAINSRRRPWRSRRSLIPVPTRWVHDMVQPRNATSGYS
jgi:hypothetical protein